MPAPHARQLGAQLPRCVPAARLWRLYATHDDKACNKEHVVCSGSDQHRAIPQHLQDVGDKLSDAANAVKKNVKKAYESTADKLGDAKDTVVEKASEAKDAITGKAADARDTVETKAHDAKHAVSNAADDVYVEVVER